MPISCHFRQRKALLVASLTHVRGAIANTVLLPFIFTFPRVIVSRIFLPSSVIRSVGCVVYFTDVSLTIPEDAVLFNAQHHYQQQQHQQQVFVAVSRDDTDRPKLTGQIYLLKLTFLYSTP